MNWYNQLVHKNDENTKMYIKHQVNDRNSRYFGGIINLSTGIPSPSHTGTGSVIGSWVCSYVNKDSEYYHQMKLKEKIEYALDYMLNQQHEDGTISPGWTNYHSPPDTAFIITGFAQLYWLLQKDGAEELKKKIKLFLQRTIPAMLTGGCHTPNHRWVLASALSNLYTIFNKPELKQRAEEWLQEGMDITEDGEWTERSNGIYNAVSNICLYHTASLLGKPELFNYIRKNLDMMKFLVHPNGEVVTDYSGRQDLGNTFDLSPYHLIYRLMAFKDENPQYMAMADLALENFKDIGPVNNHIMLGYLAFPFIQDEGIERDELPKEYELFINENYNVKDNLNKMETVGHHSKIKHSSMHTSFGAQTVRYRKNDISATIMGMNPSFFSLRHGNIKLLGTQIYTSFSPGVIEFDSVERIDGGYRLSTVLEKGYTGPLPISSRSMRSDTSVWYLLPHQLRESTHTQTHRVWVDIKREENEWTIQLQTDGLRDVFIQAVFIFDSNIKIKGNGIEKIEENNYFWKNDSLVIQDEHDKMTLLTGGYEHWQKSLGDISASKNLQIYRVNLVSPSKKQFKLFLS
ncbi:hypothetical protein GI584_06100 [Gracilibacillus salitolerans]|uniref:Heparinase II/III-like protein n=1 Tax=Gracilibacillus salitolerans TaxID=2663022 RepID=A0A5Q2TI21_9BACI|nr:hypothetical protein [Gracilibacillus salitolerans]QGH33613.1 hypothetical protein GI584_06100 [Gracilibacillus salitolerans]